MNNYRMYRQAFDTIKGKEVESGDIVQPYTQSLIKDGICPTITTRPEGFKTAILVIEEPKRTLGGCVDCDECPHRSETCLCDISDNDEDCPLL
jgi:hypothetical protein